LQQLLTTRDLADVDLQQRLSDGGPAWSAEGSLQQTQRALAEAMLDNAMLKDAVAKKW
jgi:hypothetical protein